VSKRVDEAIEQYALRRKEYRNKHKEHIKSYQLDWHNYLDKWRHY